ncbi:Uncharacterised protein [Mycobacteroides abscessus subsp. abscessus]|nr:Uncharacterised protein [Mycobacteroides abscessus subsp. abscessus]
MPTSRAGAAPPGHGAAAFAVPVPVTAVTITVAQAAAQAVARAVVRRRVAVRRDGVRTRCRSMPTSCLSSAAMR